MAAACVEREGAPLAIRRLPIPRPQRGEVLIKLAASPINPSDLGFMAGSYTASGAFPAVPGFEGSGIVVGAGPGLLPRLLAGRRVAFASPGGGAWAEYVTTAAMRCIPVGSASLESASMLIVNPLTALAFFDIVRDERHAAIVSNAAASALGRMVVRMARTLGVPVINVVRRPEQVELLRDLGAEHVLGTHQQDFPARLRESAHRLKATLVLDAVGGPHTRDLVEAAPAKSTILVYAALAGEPSVFNPRTLIGDEKRIRGFYLGHWAARKGAWRTIRDVLEVRRLMNGELRTAVSKRFPLSAAPEAVEQYRADMTSGKVLLLGAC